MFEVASLTGESITDVVSTRCENIAQRKWYVGDPRLSHALCRNNVKLFTEIFGAPRWHFKNEYRWSIWAVVFGGITYYLWSSPGGGSCYEVDTAKRPGASAIVKFRNALLDTIASHASA